MEHTKIQSPEWLFFLWLLWVIATTIGGIIFGAWIFGDEDYFSHIFMTGLIIGVAQWLVLRHYIPDARWWILASFLGLFLRTFVPYYGATIGSFGYNVINNSITFTLLGVAQWLVLRHHTQYAAWWIPVSTVSGVMSAAVSLTVTAFLGNVSSLHYVIKNVLFNGVSWAASAAVIGIMLAWLLRLKS
ncbi:hypothetical protein [uncultured Nostoc sp.]|uniref:hypothetical protein n=1 Tax=uncultured Nostoc sp. TaxID=340711 RepID=UPI0035CB661C